MDQGVGREAADLGATLLERLGGEEPADDLAVETEERDIDRSELVAASEAFFCGTAWEVTPVVSIDRLPVGTGEVGPVVRDLQSRYFRLARGETDAHREWRTPVY